jgi:CubicO group peptidase (beta-lactamase class C family)
LEYIDIIGKIWQKNNMEIKMYQLDAKTKKLIKKTTKGRKFIKLNIGFMNESQTVLKTFNEIGEIEYENNFYEIGSVTKTFTASLFAKYIHENKMQLNDSIQKYISGLDPDRYYPTLRRLITHTAGCPSNPWNTREMLDFYKEILLGYGKHYQKNPFVMDYNEMLKIINKCEWKDRDSKWSYSNIGPSLLGYAIGVTSGLEYWYAMNEFIKNEFGLRNTYLGTIEGKNMRGFNGKNEDCGNWKWEGNLIAPGGALSSTAEDLLAYAKVNMYEEKPYLPLCHQKHASGAKNWDMGLAWMIYRMKDYNVIRHVGGTGCFRTFLGFSKEKKAAVVILSNYFIFGIEKIGNSILENI